MDFLYKISAFNELTAKELYQLLAIRQDIFVVEQNCPYLDADGKDLEGYHVFCLHDEKIIACSRILPKGTSYKDYSSIGRICCIKEFRGTQVAHKIIELSIEKLQQLYPDVSIKISAQAPLQAYYEKFGFQAIGEGYLEDDIPHQAMILA